MVEERRPADPVFSTSGCRDAVDPVLHELINVLAAMRVHVFMARCALDQTLAASGVEGDGAPGADLPRDPDEVLRRIGTMVDRALEIAADLGEQVRQDWRY